MQKLNIEIKESLLKILSLQRNRSVVIPFKPVRQKADRFGDA